MAPTKCCKTQYLLTIIQYSYLFVSVYLTRLLFFLDIFSAVVFPYSGNGSKQNSQNNYPGLCFQQMLGCMNFPSSFHHFTLLLCWSHCTCCVTFTPWLLWFVKQPCAVSCTLEDFTVEQMHFLACIISLRHLFLLNIDFTICSSQFTFQFKPVKSFYSIVVFQGKRVSQVSTGLSVVIIDLCCLVCYCLIPGIKAEEWGTFLHCKSQVC